MNPATQCCLWQDPCSPPPAPPPLPHRRQGQPLSTPLQPLQPLQAFSWSPAALALCLAGETPPTPAPIFGWQAKPQLLPGPTNPPAHLELGPSSLLGLPPLHPTLEPGEISLCVGDPRLEPRAPTAVPSRRVWGRGENPGPRSPKSCCFCHR